MAKDNAARKDLAAAGWQSPPDPSRWYEAVDQLVLQLMRTASLAPMSKLVIEGSDYALENEILWRDVKHEDDEEPMRRPFKAAPLERMHAAPKQPLELYQYVAGCRWRMDWHLSQISPLSAIDYSRGAMFMTEAALKQAAKGYVAGIDGPAMAGVLRGVKSTPDTRLDAQQRVGEALRNLDSVSGWICLKLIGEEYPVTSLARMLNRDERYVNGRVRDMLDGLAKHYGMMAQARGRQRPNE